MEGCFYMAPYGELKAVSRGGLCQYVYWTRLLSFKRVKIQGSYRHHY